MLRQRFKKKAFEIRGPEEEKYTWDIREIAKIVLGDFNYKQARASHIIAALLCIRFTRPPFEKALGKRNVTRYVESAKMAVYCVAKKCIPLFSRLGKAEKDFKFKDIHKLTNAKAGNYKTKRYLGFTQVTFFFIREFPEKFEAIFPTIEKELESELDYEKYKYTLTLGRLEKELYEIAKSETISEIYNAAQRDGLTLSDFEEDPPHPSRRDKVKMYRKRAEEAKVRSARIEQIKTEKQNAKEYYHEAIQKRYEAKFEEIDNTYTNPIVKMRYKILDIDDEGNTFRGEDALGYFSVFSDMFKYKNLENVYKVLFDYNDEYCKVNEITKIPRKRTPTPPPRIPTPSDNGSSTGSDSDDVIIPERKKTPTPPPPPPDSSGSESSDSSSTESESDDDSSSGSDSDDVIIPERKKTPTPPPPPPPPPDSSGSESSDSSSTESESDDDSSSGSDSDDVIILKVQKTPSPPPPVPPKYEVPNSLIPIDPFPEVDSVELSPSDDDSSSGSESDVEIIPIPSDDDPPPPPPPKPEKPKSRPIALIYNLTDGEFTNINIEVGKTWKVEVDGRTTSTDETDYVVKINTSGEGNHIEIIDNDGTMKDSYTDNFMMVYCDPDMFQNEEFVEKWEQNRISGDSQPGELQSIIQAAEEHQPFFRESRFKFDLKYDNEKLNEVEQKLHKYRI